MGIKQAEDWWIDGRINALMCSTCRVNPTPRLDPLQD